MKVFCVLVCLALAVQARPQTKPQLAVDPAEAFVPSKPPTAIGDPIGAVGGQTKPAPVIEVLAVAKPEERQEETTTVLPEVAESSPVAKAAVETDPKPVLTTGGKDPLPVDIKPAPAAPSKPDSSEEGDSAEEAGRKKRQAPVAVSKGKKSSEESSEESKEEVTTTASAKAASAEVEKEVEKANPVKKIN